MAGNKSLHAAKKTKKDEFYTRREDIENELTHYADHFKDKVVYCNCDDPVTSEFWQFFMRNFRPWGLKKLIATHYEPDEKNYAYMLEISEDTNEDGIVDWRDEPTVTQIPCNGDFRSAACIELLKQADIVVTNPPFSLFQEYVAQLMEYKKKFVIIGPQNAITYKAIFPLLMGDKMWLGYGFNHGDAYFRVPPESAADYAAGVYNPNTGLVHFRNCTWYTNLDIPKRHAEIDTRGNYYSPLEYPSYDNYDAIEVSQVSSIPCDYFGVMGVPITFLDQYSPEQFEIVGITKTWFGAAIKSYTKQIQHSKDGKKSIVAKLNDGAALAISKPASNKTYYEVDGKYYIQMYARVLIRRKEQHHED